MYLIVVGGHLVDAVDTEEKALATAQYWMEYGHKDVDIEEQEDNEDSN